MKKFLSFFLGAALALTTGLTPLAAQEQMEIAAPPQALSDAYVVMDAKTGQVLFEKNMNKKEYPASTTKILTAALALESRKLGDKVTMTQEAIDAVPWDATHIALLVGEELTVEQLLYGTMLTSANDCANGLAGDIGGDMAAFVELMNAKLAEIGAKDSHFTNPSGLPDDNHYTTAYDMALITRYALGVEHFRQFFGATEYVIGPTNKQPQSRKLGTQSMMIVTSAYEYEGATGSKLGWTEEANSTIVTVAERNGMELICVALKSVGQYDKYKDSHQLFDYAFENFRSVRFPAQDMESKDIPLTGGEGAATANFHVFPDRDLVLQLHSSVKEDRVKITYQYPTAQELDAGAVPTVTFTGPKGAMNGNMGTYPLAVLREGVKDAAAFAAPQWQESSSAIWGVLRFVGTFLLVLLAIGAVLFAILLVLRWYILRNYRRRRRHRRPPQQRGAPGFQTARAVRKK